MFTVQGKPLFQIKCFEIDAYSPKWQLRLLPNFECDILHKICLHCIAYKKKYPLTCELEYVRVFVMTSSVESIYERGTNMHVFVVVNLDKPIHIVTLLIELYEACVHVINSLLSI